MAEFTNETEQYLPVNNGNVKGQWKKRTSLKPVYCPYGVWRFDKEMLLVSIIVNLILMSAVIALIVRRQEAVPQNPISCVSSCPNGWIGFQRRCYYFGDVNINWTSSQMECSSFNASLAAIDSQEEMDFIRRYKGPTDLWIGLHRNLETEPWKWINGTEFNNWFEVRGGGECGYMNNKKIASSSCRREERWLCSKPIES